MISKKRLILVAITVCLLVLALINIHVAHHSIVGSSLVPPWMLAASFRPPSSHDEPPVVHSPRTGPYPLSQDYSLLLLPSFSSNPNNNNSNSNNHYHHIPAHSAWTPHANVIWPQGWYNAALMDPQQTWSLPRGVPPSYYYDCQLDTVLSSSNQQHQHHDCSSPSTTTPSSISAVILCGCHDLEHYCRRVLPELSCPVDYLITTTAPSDCQRGGSIVLQQQSEPKVRTWYTTHPPSSSTATTKGAKAKTKAKTKSKFNNDRLQALPIGLPLHWYQQQLPPYRRSQGDADADTDHATTTTTTPLDVLQWLQHYRRRYLSLPHHHDNHNHDRHTQQHQHHHNHQNRKPNILLVGPGGTAVPDAVVAEFQHCHRVHKLHAHEMEQLLRPTTSTTTVTTGGDDKTPPLAKYFQLLSQHQFGIVLASSLTHNEDDHPQLAQVDTYQLWEMLFWGTIPIVQSSPSLEGLIRSAHLPVVVVDDWHDLCSWTPSEQQALYEHYQTWIRHAHHWLQPHLWLPRNQALMDALCLASGACL